VDYPAPVERLIDELRKLPGVGPKSAQRIAFHLLRGTKDDAGRLAEAIATLLDGIRTVLGVQRRHRPRALPALLGPRA
jgi:recombinational DNA repair protein RecR